MSRTTARGTRTTTRVLPHLLRRDGIVESPRDSRRSSYEVAVSIGWRPQA